MAFYLSPPIETIWLDKQYLIYQSGSTIDVIETSRVIWAYMALVERYAYGMRLQKESYCTLNLRTLQETKIEGSMSERFYCERVLVFFQKNFPHIVLGYSDRLLSLYNNHFEDFCELSRQNAAQHASWPN